MPMKNITLIILFLVIIFLPLADYLVPISSNESENRENRNLAKFPEFNIQLLDPFPSKFESFFNDHFNFRTELLSLNKYIKLDLFKESPHPSIIIGKKGYLYVRKYLNSYAVKENFSPDELKEIRQIYINRASWLKKRGIKSYFVFVPTKYNVYPEYVPKRIKRGSLGREKDQFMKAIDSIENLTIIDLEPYFLEQKKNAIYPLYYQTDQHWNEYGSFKAYRKIVDVIREDFPNVKKVNESDYIYSESKVKGKQLAKSISIEDKVEETEIKVSPIKSTTKRYEAEKKYSIPASFYYKSYYQFNYKNSDTLLPSAYIVRDSYVNAMERQLPESFGKLIYIWDNWRYRLNSEIALTEKPDIFITIVIESNLRNILKRDDLDNAVF